MLFVVPAQDEALATSGSSCEYGSIRLQIDAFTPARLEELRKEIGSAWVPVPGVGDAAYFHENRTSYAELYVSAGTHTMTIQMGVPTGSTPAAIRSNTIELAKVLIPKSR